MSENSTQPGDSERPSLATNRPERNSLLRRYNRVWQQAWRQRKGMDAPKRLPHEVQFLPAALELQDKPAHPAPRILMWAIMGFSALALIWACFGKIDVVATASGKVIPSGKTKVIQPSETAVVKAIHVRDGQAVKAGELLIELDPTSADADVGRIQSDLTAAQVDIARARAMLVGINNRRVPSLDPADLSGATLDQKLAAARWLQGQYQEYRSSLDMVDAEIAQRQADIQSARTQVASLQQTVPIATKLAQDYEHLLQKQYIARHAYLEKEQARLDLVRQLGIQQAAVIQASAAKQEAERRRDGVTAQTQRGMLDLLQQSEQKAAGFFQDLNKARYQEALTTLEAPVEGTVQQLAIHTVGGVVTPAQQLMAIVPQRETIEIEAMFENKDIGFIHPGQPVTVKVETFTFTKYGTLNGELIDISRDAIEDEKRGLIYSGKIRLEADHLFVNGQEVRLSPGMAVTAEVKTGQRRIIEYFMSPLQQYQSESIRER